jgi:hypothetical protein
VTVLVGADVGWGGGSIVEGGRRSTIRFRGVDRWGSL